MASESVFCSTEATAKLCVPLLYLGLLEETELCEFTTFTGGVAYIQASTPMCTILLVESLMSYTNPTEPQHFEKLGSSK